MRPKLVNRRIVGGACFGLPTALVAERERGVWRRYRLLPVPTSSLVAGTPRLIPAQGSPGWDGINAQLRADGFSEVWPQN